MTNEQKIIRHMYEVIALLVKTDLSISAPERFFDETDCEIVVRLMAQLTKAVAESMKRARLAGKQ